MILRQDLHRLGARSWSVPLLALLHDQDGARFATLLASLDIARDSLTRTLTHAQTNNWIMRNPGHGHPLRPEYILTPQAIPLAAACARLMQQRRRCAIAPQHLPRWSLPIIAVLGPAGARFNDLLAALAPATPRALSLNLKQMAQGGIVTRTLEPGFPPTTSYALTEAGQHLLKALQ